MQSNRTLEIQSQILHFLLVWKNLSDFGSCFIIPRVSNDTFQVVFRKKDLCGVGVHFTFTFLLKVPVIFRPLYPLFIDEVLLGNYTLSKLWPS